MRHQAVPRYPKKILVIRRDNIGDLVCTTPAFAALRQHYPDAQIGALVNSYNAEVLHGNPNVDHVFVYQKLKHATGFIQRIKALSQRLKLVARLRRWKPDITILAKSSYDRHGLNFARQIGAKSVIGFVPNDPAQAKSLPDIRLDTPSCTAMHEVEAVNLLLAPLGIKDALGPLQAFAEQNALEKLKLQLPEAKQRIALHISAREPERRWGAENYIALIEHILRCYKDSQIFLFWAPGRSNDPHHPGDDEVAALLLKTVRSERLLPMRTKNLTELITALSLCDLFIGTDGGAMHLGVALNKKTLALFESSSSKLNHWYPWRVEHRTVHSLNEAMPNISQVSQKAVQEALAQII